MQIIEQLGGGLAWNREKHIGVNRLKAGTKEFFYYGPEDVAGIAAAYEFEVFIVETFYAET